MAKLYNLARMNTATTGTGTITLGSAVQGYLTFGLAGVANGDIVSYGIKDGANSEVGTGTYTSAGTTLSRTVTKSTNSDAAISLSGAAEVFITIRKEDFSHAPGEPSTGSAAAGEIGEYIESVIATGSAVALTTGVAKNVTSISLTPGDWDVNGNVTFNGGATTTVGASTASISLTTATNDATLGRACTAYNNNVAIFAQNTFNGSIPPVRLSLSSTTTVFLVASLTFGVSTANAFGIISARRAR